MLVSLDNLFVRFKCYAFRNTKRAPLHSFFKFSSKVRPFRSPYVMEGENLLLYPSPVPSISVQLHSIFVFFFFFIFHYKGGVKCLIIFLEEAILYLQGISTTMRAESNVLIVYLSPVHKVHFLAHIALMQNVLSGQEWKPC